MNDKIKDEDFFNDMATGAEKTAGNRDGMHTEKSTGT